MRKFLTMFIFFVSLLPVFQAEAKQPAPAEVPSECYCSECGMYIKGAGLKFASEIIFKDGKTVYFCDLGDLFLYFDVLGNKQDVAAVYVKDYPTGGWVEGRSCFYLAKSGVVTPMRYGILAFKDKAVAEKYKKEKGGGGIYDFDGLVASRIFRR